MSDIENTLPIASAVPAEEKPKVRRIRKPKVVVEVAPPAPVEEVVEEAVVVAPAPIVEEEVAVAPAPAEEVNDDSAPAESAESEETITIKKSEWEALLARVASLEEKPVAPPKDKKAPAGRIATKDVVLKNILTDNEIVYAKELINAGDRKGEYRTLSATFSSKHNGFHINSIADFDYDESSNEFKTPYAMSPTTLCSRFRKLMNQHGESEKDSSTCCGFAKCYVIREGKEIKLNKLW
jgi:hypothetical protein